MPMKTRNKARRERRPPKRYVDELDAEADRPPSRRQRNDVSLANATRQAGKRPVSADNGSDDGSDMDVDEAPQSQVHSHKRKREARKADKLKASADKAGAPPDKGKAPLSSAGPPAKRRKTAGAQPAGAGPSNERIVLGASSATDDDALLTPAAVAGAIASWNIAAPAVAPPRGKKGREIEARAKRAQSASGQVAALPATLFVEPTLGAGLCVDACCSRCAGLAAFGAIAANDETALAQLRDDKRRVASVWERPAPNVFATPVDAALRSGNLALFKCIEDDAHKRGRVQFPVNTIKQDNDTGFVGRSTYNHAVRKVNAARGGREGNVAFVDWPSADPFVATEQTRRYSNDESRENDAFVRCLNGQGLTAQVVDYWALTYSHFCQSSGVFYACEAGQREVAERFVRAADSSWGFNDLHLKVLSGEALGDFRAVQATKKAVGNQSITPVHMAAINPDPSFLATLLNEAKEGATEATGSLGRTAAHFAAACVGDRPLRHLVGAGCNIGAPDKAGVTPLHMCARFGRTHNVAVFAESSGGSLEGSKPDKKGRTAVQYASHFGHPHTLAALIAHGAPLDVADKDGKITPLMEAARSGHRACAEILLAAGADAEATDKAGRTPLHHAAKNGAARIIALLLSTGCNPDCADSSGNTPLHYAAAYGWDECVRILIHGGGANASALNAWKVGPLFIAMIKGHMRCAETLMSHPGVDVNQRDAEGQTMLHHVLSSPSDGTRRQVEFLLARGASVAIADAKGFTALHAHFSRDKERDRTLANYDYAAAEKAAAEKAAAEKAVPEEAREGVPQVAAEPAVNTDVDMASASDAENSAGEEDSEAGDSDGNEEDEGADDSDGSDAPEAMDAAPLAPAALPAPDNDVIAIAHMLLKGGGADPCAADGEGNTAVSLSVRQGSMRLFRVLADAGVLDAACSVRTSNGRNLLHTILGGDAASHVHPQHWLNILYAGVAKATLCRMAREVDEKGFTPLHLLCLSYTGFSDHTILTLVSSFCAACSPDMNAAVTLDPSHAGRTALHFVAHTRPDLVEELVKLGCSPSVADARGNYPLHSLLSFPSGRRSLVVTIASLKCLLHGPAVNARNNKGETPLLLAVRSCDWRVVGALLDAGADVNVVDKDNRTPLAIVAAETGDNTITVASVLLMAGANPDAPAGVPGAPVPLVAAASKGLAVVVRMLADAGADLNAQTTAPPEKSNGEAGAAAPVQVQVFGYHHHQQQSETVLVAGTTALHALVARMSKSPDNIELAALVRVLVERGARTDLRDSKGRTLLHLCFPENTFSDEYLRQQQQAMQYHHYGYGHQAQKDQDPIAVLSDVCPLPGIDVDARDAEGRTPLHFASASNAIISSIYLLQRGADVNARDAKGNGPLQVAIARKHKEMASVLASRGADPRAPYVEASGASVTTFRAAASAQMKALCYLMVGAGMDVVTACEDSLALGDADGMRAIMAKADDAQLRGTTARGRNLYHACAQYPALFPIDPLRGWGFEIPSQRLHGKSSAAASSGGSGSSEAVVDASNPFARVRQIRQGGGLPAPPFTALTSASQYAVEKDLLMLIYARGVDACAVDADGDTPLHIACEKANVVVVWHLLQCNASVSARDRDGRTPLGRIPVGSTNENVQRTLAEVISSGACVTDALPKGSVPLFYTAVLGGNQNVAWSLVRKGADANEPHPNTGRTALSEALRTSSLSAIGVCVFIAKMAAPLRVDIPDNEGRNALHYAVGVSQSSFARHEKTAKVLKMLAPKVATGFENALRMRDAVGMTPVDYARRLRDPAAIEALREMDASAVDEAMARPLDPLPPLPPFPTLDAPAIPVSPQADAQAMREKHAAAVDAEWEKSRREGKVTYAVDEEGNFPATAVVHTNAAGVAFDALLHRADASYGVYGKNDFYRMQVVHIPTQDLFLLWTRWGRVGETGMHQKTPFPSAAEAETEFAKIFRSKTGNAYDAPAFEPVPGKYRLQSVATRPDPGDALCRFDPAAGGLPTQLDGRIVRLLRLATNTKLLKGAFERKRIGDGMLGRVPDSAVVDAVAALADIAACNDEIAAADKALDVARLRAAKERMPPLLNRFYELVPHTSQGEMTISDINDKIRMLVEIGDLQVAARLHLGAQLRQAEMNPAEYVFRGLGVDIRPVEDGTDEFAVIQKYFTLSKEHDSLSIDTVFAVRRPGEAASVDAHAAAGGECMLLWHGSGLENSLGILADGLRIAPPHAKLTGSMFGKGIYFANAFAKSSGYCGNGHFGSDAARNHRVAFLCRVALGRQSHGKHFTCAEDVAARDGEFDSTYGCGNNRPDPDNRYVLQRGGAVVPMGPLVPVPWIETREHTCGLNYDEFVVYDPSRVEIQYAVLFRVTGWKKKKKGATKSAFGGI